MDPPMRDSVTTLSEASPTAVFDVGAQLEFVRSQDQVQDGTDRTVIFLKRVEVLELFPSGWAEHPVQYLD